MIHSVYASILNPGHICPEIIGALRRASISMRATSRSHLTTVDPSRMHLMTKIQRSRPGPRSPAQGSCSRPACRSAVPRQSASVCLGYPIFRCCRFNSPPTWRIAGPCLHGARRQVACRPSGFGARRGRRRRGSGCSCAIGRNAPSASEFGAGNRWSQILVGVSMGTHLRPAAFHANVILSDCLWG